jgi:hypothetical protein
MNCAAACVVNFGVNMSTTALFVRINRQDIRPIVCYRTFEANSPTIKRGRLRSDCRAPVYDPSRNKKID